MTKRELGFGQGWGLFSHERRQSQDSNSHLEEEACVRSLTQSSGQNGKRDRMFPRSASGYAESWLSGEKKELSSEASCLWQPGTRMTLKKEPEKPPWAGHSTERAEQSSRTSLQRTGALGV